MSSEAEAPEIDSLRQPLLDTLLEQLGEAVVGSEIANGDIVVRVERSAWKQAALVCRDALDMRYFCFLSGIDWLATTDLAAEKAWQSDDMPLPADDEDAAGDDAAEGAEVETAAVAAAGDQGHAGVAGGDSRFQVFARLYSIRARLGVTLKADLDEADPRVESWVDVFRGADWHEREAWEMYGFEFDGHPGLRHLYLPSEFEGHPLRKDFPLLAREVKPWPGLVDVEPLPGEAEGDSAEGGE